MLSKLNILIVDDNPAVRTMTRFYLQDIANEIRECEDGADAFTAYAEFQPDWVLMDWQMKRLDGLAATREIKLGFPNAKIVMVTQHNDAELRTAADEAGVCGFISKDDLMSLRELLERQN
ncbi:MAG: response regulator transcription factor [Acidobacteria bacterium]|nr:response regulator transcription factor [Acidobacteriota bacterium]